MVFLDWLTLHAYTTTAGRPINSHKLDGISVEVERGFVALGLSVN